jgi:predicted acyltransferase
MSIDALRGFDMFWIIGGEKIFASLQPIFNHPVTAWIKTQLTHVEWEGFRFEDLIMPLFLFVAGVVMPFSFANRTSRGDTRRKIYLHVVKRTLVLFILGMVAQGHLLEYDLSKLHLYSNTLQAIAAGYLLSALIILNWRLAGRVIMTAILLLLFWALMALVPVAGHGPGELTPDGNFAIFIDKLVLGRFQDGTAYTWLLSSMTFACTVMLGVFAGAILACQKKSLIKVSLLTALGIGCVALGLLWNAWFPIIKHLWTSSFVLFSGGICCLLLAGFYLLIDVIGLRKWAFLLVVIGVNAIGVYMVTRLFNFGTFGDILVGALFKYCGAWKEFIRAVAGFTILWLILFWMYRKKSFIKI